MGEAMERRLVIEFTKMEAAGNDFIVIDNRFFHFDDDDLAQIASRFCTRRLGIGADGLLALNGAEDRSHLYRMKYRNADGSLGTMCGNGARCLALFANHAGVIDSEGPFLTDAGLYRAELRTDPDRVRIYYPGPAPAPQNTVTISADGAELEVTAIWTGTEHAVCFVPDVGQIDVGRVGPIIRRHASFPPPGVNADFVEVVGFESDAPAIKMRTFEKGVEEETLSCGTGAIASAIVARERHFPSASQVSVLTRGGELIVGGLGGAADGHRHLYLEGPARATYRGTFEYEPA